MFGTLEVWVGLLKCLVKHSNHVANGLGFVTLVLANMQLAAYWANTPGHPNFVENVHFHINCRLSVRPLGHPNGLNPTVPRAPLKIPCWIGAQNPFLAYFVDCPCQALVAPFIILSGSHSNAHQNCVF